MKKKIFSFPILYLRNSWVPTLVWTWFGLQINTFVEEEKIFFINKNVYENNNIAEIVM